MIAVSVYPSFINSWFILTLSTTSMTDWENKDATTELFSPHCISVQISIHRRINMQCESRNLCTLVSCIVYRRPCTCIQDARVCMKVINFSNYQLKNLKDFCPESFWSWISLKYGFCKKLLWYNGKMKLWPVEHFCPCFFPDQFCLVPK